MNLFFNKNYNNKLNNETFTTFRLANAEKFKVGTKFTVKLRTGNGMINHGEYEVIKHRELDQHQVNDWMAQIDCATDPEGLHSIMRECYPNEINSKSKYSYVLLKKVKKECTQQTLM